MNFYKILHQIFIVILICYSNYRVIAVTEQNYDPSFIRDLRRIFYTFFQGFQDLEQTRRFHMMQDEVPKSTKFYCDGKNGPGKRSSVRPTSINELRPGDIDIIAAIGDSLTGGTALSSTQLLDIIVENRGMVFSIGGQGTWRQFTTLPNILKEFNPNLYGYSLGNSGTVDRDSKFNVAEGAAESKDLLYSGKVLKNRLIHDPKVNMTNDWKLLTIFIGGIDFCHLICYEKDSQLVLKRREQDLLKSFRYLRDNIPRLMINLISPPNILPLVKNKSTVMCHFWNSLVCPCFTMKTKKWLDRVQQIVLNWYKMDKEVVNRDEFHTNDFTVNYQPFITNFLIPTLKNGYTDLRYFAIDCLHFSQRMHRLGAIALWNNMLEYNDEKSFIDYRNVTFKCPTIDQPFITTRQSKNITNLI